VEIMAHIDETDDRIGAPGEGEERFEGLGIAVVGMAGRFPGARDLGEYWRNLCEGVDSIASFTDEELAAAGVAREEREAPNYVKAAPVLRDVELFDAGLFGYTPLEARLIDPQQRLLLECAWEALEHAGYAPGAITDPVSVFAGARASTYFFQVLAGGGASRSEDRLLAEIGNDVSSVATRLSYKLDLRGPSYTVQTACSTSLAAVHLACQSLLLGECRLALAGAAAVLVPHRAGYLHDGGSILSPDGRCRPFDAAANGTVFGSGAGVVALKRLPDAIADGDRIWAVVRGSAVNNDGGQKASYTAPGVEGQTEVILEALASAGLDADAISYVEAHGTATPLGDPIEILALSNAWRAGAKRQRPCRIGTVKGNFGHLDAAAGMAGFIKTVLALAHRRLPPTLHFAEPSPRIDFAAAPFEVNARLDDWPGPSPRFAGVSSFGFGGTNAHVVLEEAPKPAPAAPSTRPRQLVVLSARSPAALEAATARLAAHLREQPGLDLADVAHTLQVGRRDFDHRLALVCRDTADAAAALEARDPERLLGGVRQVGDRPAFFLFGGQGAQHPNMGRELYETEPVFREEVDRCAQTLAPRLGLDLRGLLYPDAARAEEAARRLDETALAQPALFVTEYALAKLLLSWGIKPRAMIGHSVGEFVAATLAGVFSLDDALGLVAERGRLMQATPRGAMIAVSLSPDELAPLLSGSLEIAAVNAASLCAVSGPQEEVHSFERALGERGVSVRRLHTSHAFHSAMMEPALAPFREALRRVALRPPETPVVSNLTGTFLTPEQATDPDYWVRHLRERVRFADGLRTLLADPDGVLLEVGPGQVLSSLARQEPAAAGRPVLAALGRAREQGSDAEHLLGALARLWLSGVRVDWAGHHARERRRRAALPTYPFEGQRHWVDAPGGFRPPSAPSTSSGWTPQRRDLADWFYLPGWKQSVLPASEVPAGPQRWVVFADGDLGAALAERLAGEGHDVITVTPGERYVWSSKQACSIDPRRREDYAALIAELDASGRSPQGVAHLWCAAEGPEEGALEHWQERGFYSLLFLAQAIGERAKNEPLKLITIATRLQEIEGADVVCAEKATLLGPCRVIPREYPHVASRVIDLAPPAADRLAIVGRLVAELTGPADEPLVAWRGRNRWVQSFEPFRPGAMAKPASGEAPPRVRPGARVLITGGMGGIGWELASFFAREAKARLVLVGRSKLPAREAWGRWLEEHDEGDEVSAKLRKLRALEEAGAEVLALSADVADEGQMRGVLAQARERWGGLDGVVHAAGVAGGGLIQLKTREGAEKVLAPKVQGARVLDGLLRDTPLDFFVLFSSITALVGELGQSDYCAANAYLDAFARHVSRRGTHAVAVNWDMWHGAGMAVDSHLPPALKAWREVQLRLAIRADEGTEALGRVLAGDVPPQVVVSTTHLPELLEQVKALAQGGLLAQLAAPTPGTTRPRPALANAYVAPRTDAERALAAIWQTLLGVEQVGAHDSFFDLGGHSLLATQLRNQISQTFKVDPPLRSLFEKPTLSAVAALVEGEVSKKGALPEEPIAQRLRKAFPTERQAMLEEYLRRRVEKVAGGPRSGDGFEGLDLRQLGAELEYDLKQDFKFQFYPHETRLYPATPALARYLLAEMDRLADPARVATDRPLSSWPLRSYREPSAAAARVRRGAKNPPALFVHSSPRAGSTLLRVMLAGHPRLFCPPELNLLFFESMRDWRQNVGFGHALDWTEGGLEWAFVELLGLDSKAAAAHVDRLVADDVPVQEVYRSLQQHCAPRLLADKTPPYAMDPASLERAEQMFDRPKYLFLFRHPYSVLESVMRLRMDRLFGPSLFGRDDVDPYAVAETVWALPNRNLLAFFDRIGPERHHRVRYEDLVRDPAGVMKGVCDFLEVPYDPRVLEPYDGKRERMLGGLGDPNIMQHNRIEADLAEAWKKVRWPRPLDASTRELCARLGYEIADDPAPPPAARHDDAAEAERLLTGLDQMSDEQVAALLAELSGQEGEES
jgi:acyl transferase domain-containing protein